jgi:type II secretory pathway predicted ATPase ExeA
MADKKLQALYGLKWNPFLQDVPTEALLRSPQLETMCWRVENLVRDGGFALLTGDNGIGKSAAFRILADRLSNMRDVVVGELTRPQSRITDFYRELGHMFGVAMTASNRWGGFKTLREKWQSHIESTLTRPVLLCDEAQELPVPVLTEIRMLSSQRFDSQSVLTVVLAGDGRLIEKLKNPDLLPLASRIRVRIHLDPYDPDALEKLLRHAIAQAGNVKLVANELVPTLAERAMGNPRTLFGLAADLLDAAAAREAKHIDEKLYFDVFSQPPSSARSSKAEARAKVR